MKHQWEGTSTHIYIILKLRGESVSSRRSRSSSLSGLAYPQNNSDKRREERFKSHLMNSTYTRSAEILCGSTEGVSTRAVWCFFFLRVSGREALVVSSARWLSSTSFLCALHQSALTHTNPRKTRPGPAPACVLFNKLRLNADLWLAALYTHYTMCVNPY